MTTLSALIAEPKNFSDKAFSILSESISTELRAIEQDQVADSLTRYDILWIRLGLTLRAPDIPDNPRCRIVVTATTGTDHIDIDALKQQESIHFLYAINMSFSKQ